LGAIFLILVVLKDVSVSVMTELLQFMYQGEVNVKHTELQSFMKIAETLQIKGLTTSQKQTTTAQKPTTYADNHHTTTSNVIETKINSPSSSIKSELNNYMPQKRHSDYVANDPYPIYPKKQLKRTPMDHQNDSMDSDSIDLAPDEVFMPAVSMIEHGSVKRETPEDLNSPNNSSYHQRASHTSTSTPHALHPGFLYDHNMAANYSKIDYPNDLNYSSDYGKNTMHMDIPAGE
jgi:hypothetical protein